MLGVVSRKKLKKTAFERFTFIENSFPLTVAISIMFSEISLSLEQ